MGPRVRQSPWGSNRTKAAPLRRDWAPHPRAEPPTHSCGSSGSGSSCTCRTRHRSRSHLGRESGRQPRDGTGRDGHSRDGALTGGTRAVLGVHGLAWLGSVGFGSARLAAVRTRSDRALFMRWRRGAVLGAAHGGAGPRSLGAVLSAGPCSAWGRAHPGAVLTPGRCRGAVLTRGRAVLNPGHGTVVPVVVPPPPGSQPAVGRPGDPTRTQFCPSAPPPAGCCTLGGRDAGRCLGGACDSAGMALPPTLAHLGQSRNTAWPFPALCAHRRGAAVPPMLEKAVGCTWLSPGMGQSQHPAGEWGDPGTDPVGLGC